MTFIEHYERTARTTDKGSTHSYICWFYAGQFETKRDEALRIVEIGVETGNSLEIWAGWMPNAIVTGVDINPTQQNFLHPNIKFIQGDAYSVETVNRFDDGSQDYVIDDGPHTLESQLKCIELWMPKLKSGGKLVIEDVQDLEMARKAMDALVYPYVIVDARKYKGRFDDVIFCLTK